MCADIHDGQEHKSSVQGPDTEAQDQSSPDHHIRLATHGRSIQRCQYRTHAVQQTSIRTYSITSSARASSVGVRVRPSAFAVLRLITSWNWVGCWTGRSEGFAPFKILST